MLGVNAGRQQQRHCHRIKDGDERQREQPDRSLKVRGGYTDQLGEISYRSDLSLGTPALRVLAFSTCRLASQRDSL
jgi:hypothetical protein